MILKYAKLNKWVNTVIAIAMLVAAVVIGLNFPVYLTRETWHLFIFAYIFIASVVPVWALLQLKLFKQLFINFYDCRCSCRYICFKSFM
ncbi:MAG: carbon starvation CstA family protein [Eubacterium sp.]